MDDRRDAVSNFDLRECSCGRWTLRVGSVQLDLSRAELTLLHQLLHAATAALVPGPVPAPVRH